MKDKPNKRRARQKASIRQLLGIENIHKDGVSTRQGDLVFFLLKPTNIAVLSEANTEKRVMALADVLKSFPDIEILCLNSRENFEGNKRYLLQRIAEEPVPQIRGLLEQDLRWLDTVQSSMATSREFALVVRLNDGAPVLPAKKKTASKGGKPYKAGASMPDSRPQRPAGRSPKSNLLLARLEKTLKGRGFSVRPADSQEIMRLLALYFSQNVTTERFEDDDGDS